MSYIAFQQNELINLQYSLGRELLRTNDHGSYASSTIINCHTRRYHGLLVVPQPHVDNELHVLLSSLDETIVQHDSEFHLSIHKYPGGVFHPKGHKYIVGFTADPLPTWTYQVGGVKLTKQILLSSRHDRVLIRYLLEEARSPTVLRLEPFLAFRQRHRLTSANVHADHRHRHVANGIGMKLYPGYSTLYMQCSRRNEFVPRPDWHYRIEYAEDQAMGHDYQEDLFVPGHFEIALRKGVPVIFAAGVEEVAPDRLSGEFNREASSRVSRRDLGSCLAHAAQQFIVTRKKDTEVVAGYHWFGTWGRDTFIALPGLTLAENDLRTFRAVYETMLGRLRNGLFPNTGQSYQSIDAPLWSFWALQQYVARSGDAEGCWKRYRKWLVRILEAYRKGTDHHIGMDADGLVRGGRTGMALTWMDAVVDGRPVTPRTGKAVEVNALWYNAIRFCLELAERSGDKAFVRNWGGMPDRVRNGFMTAFWDADEGLLADVVDEGRADRSMRPNQVIAASLPHPVLEGLEDRARMLARVNAELVTPRGLRTLSPSDPAYRGTCSGDRRSRDSAYHQGTVWPWLFGPFAEAWLNVHGAQGVPYIRELLEGFGPCMLEHGISTLSEIHDGDPPHTPRGAISQAWSVAELRRVGRLLGQLEKAGTLDGPAARQTARRLVRQ